MTNFSSPNRKNCQGGNQGPLSVRAPVLLGYRWTCRDPPSPWHMVLYDELTGESIDMQLKATDSIAYVNDTIDEVGSEHVMLTSELAEQMGL